MIRVLQRRKGATLRERGQGAVNLPTWSLADAGLGLLLILPGALVVYLAFNSGGFFAVTTAVAALAALAAVTVRLVAAPKPLGGFTGAGALACGSLALFAIWTLASDGWSSGGAGPLLAFDRILLYLAVLTLFASLPRSERRLRWLLRGLFAAGLVVSTVALLSRLLPALWPTVPGLVDDRLSYPVTYWNSLGLLVGITAVLAIHHACDEREPGAIRAGAAGALPLLGATLLLTFSRGAIAVTVIGILAYVAIGRPRGLLTGILAAAPTTAVAMVLTYSARLIHGGTPLTPAAIAEGRQLALSLAACCAGAVLLRALLLPLDARLRSATLPISIARRTGAVGAGAAGAAVLVVFLALGGPARLHSQYEKFVDDSGGNPVSVNDQRGRLLNVGNDGRLAPWSLALDSFDRSPLHGTGAGSYRVNWQRSGESRHDRFYAYSLYAEVLGELGLVGLALLVATLASILVGIAVAARGPPRPAYAAAFALSLAWIVHAGLDLDWQTPVSGIAVFGLGGLALARPLGSGVRSAAATRRRWSWGRPAVALACLTLATIPGRMALAQADLESSIDALDAGACRRAEGSARDAISLLETGPRPYEVLAMCASRRGDARAALSWARAAVAHEPESWEPHYALALVQGAAGIDPRPEARIALASYPDSQYAREAAAAFGRGGAKRWGATARSLPFSLE
jgi:hypothetical protein